jgi:hypothetical protein
LDLPTFIDLKNYENISLELNHNAESTSGRELQTFRRLKLQEEVINI